VSQNRGFAFSESLQGYAPIGASLLSTNMWADGASSSASERIDGHRCAREEITVAASDGSQSQFEIWRAVDLKNLCLRIASKSDKSPFTAQLSGVRFEPVPAAVFEPPSGFTQYPTLAAMLDELALRDTNLRKDQAEDDFRNAELNRQRSPYIH